MYIQSKKCKHNEPINIFYWLNAHLYIHIFFKWIFKMSCDNYFVNICGFSKLAPNSKHSGLNTLYSKFKYFSIPFQVLTIFTNLY